MEKKAQNIASKIVAIWDFNREIMLGANGRNMEQWKKSSTSVINTKSIAKPKSNSRAFADSNFQAGLMKQFH